LVDTPEKSSVFLMNIVRGVNSDESDLSCIMQTVMNNFYFFDIVEINDHNHGIAF